MKKILIVFGTRPEAIKMAPLIMEFEKYHKEFETVICVTAQHRQMLDQTLNLFKISPDYDLDIMIYGQDLYDITANVLLKIKEVLKQFMPDLVLVQGDTTTTFATGLAAYYQKIDIGHVEAGLRTNDKYSPYPEEVNRQLTSKIAKYHFAPTLLDKQNLLKENINAKNIIVTGNTVIDALFMILEQFNKEGNLEKRLIKKIVKLGYTKCQLDPQRKFILVTGHRRESFGKGFLNICKALKEIASKYPEIDVVYPVHMNPNVRKPVFDILAGINNIYLVKPIDYEAFVYLMSKSYLILTDSGGVQEEAPSLNKPVLVMRDVTERLAAVEAGAVKVIGTNHENIVQEVTLLVESQSNYQKMIEKDNPYGDGTASKKIVEFIRNHLS